jgi:hypothetical protein
MSQQVMGPASQTDFTLPSSSQNLTLPKLEANGSNWVLYKARIISALTYRRVIHYVDSCVKKPQAPSTNTMSDVKDKYENDLENWEIGNEHARLIILSTLLETYQNEVIGLQTAAETWKSISSKFDDQSKMVQIDILRQ